jgi:predicted metal-dependent hydrolase
MNEQLVVDELVFDVRRSARRNTVELIVDRGGELRITAPPRADNERLRRFVRENRFWLYTKIAEKESRQQPAGGKQFVGGEGFPYLGRSYRLQLVDRQDVPLKLVAGRFRLQRSLVGQGREQFVRWYSERGAAWLARRVPEWSKLMAVVPSGIDVRDLGFRWGSCGKGAVLHFHWAAILLPPTAIEYVIVHELAHMREVNHTPEFWRLVGRALPDYRDRREWLAKHGGGLTL